MLLAIVVAACLVYRQTRLPDIPDVGEPFDVAKFSSRTVAEDKNAFTLYREAGKQLVELKTIVGDNPQRLAVAEQDLRDAPMRGLATANANVQTYLARNQKALEIWKRGTDRSAALAVPLDQVRLESKLHEGDIIRTLVPLALLEADRVSAAKPGDAWPWYRACLRSSRHAAMNGATTQRVLGVATWQITLKPVIRWSQRPELTAAELRQALADAIAISGLTPPCSDCLKVEYLTMRHEADPYLRGVGAAGSQVDECQERIRRSMNLIYANWLAQADQPRADRLPLVFDSPELYAIGEAGRSDSKLRDPGDVKRWIALPRGGTPLLLNVLRGQVYILSSSFFMIMLPSPSALYDAIDREATYCGVLILDLALQAYHREHGHFPADLQALVKEGYLKELPADPFAKRQALRYRRQTEPKEQAVVWSVWYDGIDQDGQEAEGNDLLSRGDKVYRLAAPKSAPPAGSSASSNK
jgi:hypothetical protein